MNHLPKLSQSHSPGTPTDKSIHFSPVLAEVAQLEIGGVFTRMKTAAEGLSEPEAAARLVEIGHNLVAAGKYHGWPWRLLTAARNPLVILLGVLATISFATGDLHAGSVMTLMLSVGVLLRFVQEARADAAAEKLKAMIALWDDYAKRNNVILPIRGPFETLEKVMPQRVQVEEGFPPLVYKRQFVPPKDMMADPKP